MPKPLGVLSHEHPETNEFSEKYSGVPNDTLAMMSLMRGAKDDDFPGSLGRRLRRHPRQHSRRDTGGSAGDLRRRTSPRHHQESKDAEMNFRDGETVSIEGVLGYDVPGDEDIRINFPNGRQCLCGETLGQNGEPSPDGAARMDEPRDSRDLHPEHQHRPSRDSGKPVRGGTDRGTDQDRRIPAP